VCTSMRGCLSIYLDMCDACTRASEARSHDAARTTLSPHAGPWYAYASPRHDDGTRCACTCPRGRTGTAWGRNQQRAVGWTAGCHLLPWTGPRTWARSGGCRCWCRCRCRCGSASRKTHACARWRATWAAAAAVSFHGERLLRVNTNWCDNYYVLTVQLSRIVAAYDTHTCARARTPIFTLKTPIFL
jgi:hypothetical protein